MHNLRAERFFTPRMINGRMASAGVPIKTQGFAALPA
jgi:hypothetical protein